MKQIFKNFLKGIKQIGTETVEQGAKETVKVAETIITGKELLGDITTMTQGEYHQKKEDQKNKDEEELAKIRSQMKEPGRNVTAEMEQVYKEKKNKEDEDERKFLENLQLQRERERQEMEAMGVEPEGRQARGKMNGGKKRKKQQPDAAAMSQTQEIKGKVD